MLKRYALFLIVILCIGLVYPAFAISEANSVHINQVDVKGTSIKAYFEAVGEESKPFAEIQKSQVTASIGDNKIDVKDIKPFVKTGENCAYTFLVDISKSLQQKEFEQLRNILGDFINDLSDKDQAAIVTFGKDVRVVQQFTSDKKELNVKIGELKLTDDTTQLYKGILRGLEISTTSGMPTHRAIIVISDGEEDFNGGIARREVQEKIVKSGIPIYAIGFNTPPVTEAKKEYLSVLGNFARVSGGDYYELGIVTFLEAYQDIQSKFRKCFLAELDYKELKITEGNYKLQMFLSTGSNKISGGTDIQLAENTPKKADVPEPAPVKDTKPEKEPEKKSFNWKSQPIWVYLITGAAVILILSGLIILLLKRKQKPSKKAATQTFNSDANTSYSSSSFSQNEMNSSNSAAFSSNEPVTAKSYVKHESATLTPEEKSEVKFTLTEINAQNIGNAYEFELLDRIIIGSSTDDADLSLQGDDEISPMHCEVFYESGAVFIRDLTSSNGVYVNGAAIKTYYRLRSNDTVLLGKRAFRVGIRD